MSIHLLLPGCMVLVACGSQQRVDSSAAPPPDTVVSTSSVPQAPEPATVESTRAVRPQSKTIESALGVATYEAPAGTIDEVYPHPNLPDFVVGFDQWIVTDCCRLKVVLQSVQPLMMEDELIDTFTSNGFDWRVYDTGPRDGTQISTTTTVGPLSVLVGVQNLFGDRPIDPSATHVATMVARTVTITTVRAP